MVGLEGDVSAPIATKLKARPPKAKLKPARMNPTAIQGAPVGMARSTSDALTCNAAAQGSSHLAPRGAWRAISQPSNHFGCSIVTKALGSRILIRIEWRGCGGTLNQVREGKRR